MVSKLQAMGSDWNSEYGNLLFFPKCDAEFFYKGNVKISWFESSFSQSQYNGTFGNGSNACTIIAVLVAAKCHKEQIEVHKKRYNLLEIIK